jgi:hypothetical protein
MSSSSGSELQDALVAAAKRWYEGNRKADSGSVNTNVMNAGLIVSEMVADGLPITEDRLYSKNRSQVKGLGGKAIQKILKRHGENRTFTREGGRTSRGTVHLAKSFSDVLNGLVADVDIDFQFSNLSYALEFFFTDCVRKDYFDKQRIAVEVNADKPIALVVKDILDIVAERSDNPTGSVLQHLVGAKLQLRFPNERIGTDHANAADLQTGRAGDFQVGDTAFHVTVAPMEHLIERCKENLRDGLRPVILTVDRRLQAAQQMLDIAGVGGSVIAQSAENFIGTNIEEIAGYRKDGISHEVVRLVRAYNRRIEVGEVDKSLMIEEPSWFQNID